MKRGALAYGIGRAKGGWNTKLQAVCDAKGRPHVLLLTPGNVHDCKVARLCIEALPPSAELVADKGYDSQALREWLDERGTEAVIPPRRNRKGPVRLRPHRLQATQRHRAHVLPYQRLESPRHPLRSQPQKLPRCRRSRRSRHLVAVVSPDPNKL